MKIGLNMLFLVPGKIGGLETYARGLVRGLTRVDDRNEYVILANGANASTWETLPPNFSVHECPLAGENKIARTLFEETRLNAIARRLKIDLLHSINHVAPPRRRGLASIVTIPDIIFLRFPGEFGPIRRRVAGHLARRSARSCDRIVTLSEFCRGEIRKQFGVPASQVDVTYLAAGEFPENAVEAESFFRERRIPERYIYSVVSTYYHKNLDGLLRAFALLKQRHRIPQQLVISGLKMAAHDRFLDRVGELGLRDCVIFTGWAPAAAVRALYQRTDCFVYPSLYEGFGLPVLEAMSLGAPVACSNTTSLPEVAGDAAITFDPRNPESMAEAIGRCLEDATLRQSLIEKGRARAAMFSWEACAQATLECYRKAGACKAM